MKKTDLAYVAGIIDGEGWISIKNRTIKNGNRNYALKVGVGNTNEWLINWLKFSFGGSVCLKKKWLVNQKQQWIWDLSTKQASEFLKLILPYLRLKKPQAELAISFQSRRKYRGNPNWKIKGKRRMSDAEIALDEADKTLMHSYNKRGIDNVISKETSSN
jgi:hypothetical protein